MKRSGNHTHAKQYLYILCNVPYIWVCKIGIGGNRVKRISDIDRHAPGKDFPVFYARLHFAYGLEQALHGMFAPLNYRASRRKWGSGYTERFWLPVVLIAWPLAMCFWLFQWAVYIAAGVGVLYLLIYS